jgi:hypothetical protein
MPTLRRFSILRARTFVRPSGARMRVRSERRRPPLASSPAIAAADLAQSPLATRSFGRFCSAVTIAACHLPGRSLRDLLSAYWAAKETLPTRVTRALWLAEWASRLAWADLVIPTLVGGLEETAAAVARLPQRHRVDSGTLTTNDVGCSGGGFSLHQNSCAAARSARPEKR